MEGRGGMCVGSRDKAKYSVGCAQRRVVAEERVNGYEGKRYVVN
jgi:hypothetical protein